jgi:hypothetical protein
MRRAAVWAACLLAACGDGATVTDGLEQPIRIPGAQFVEGKLPGQPPLTAEQINAGEQAVSPTPTSASFIGRGLTQQETEVPLQGHASADAYAVGIALAEQGSGYWLLQVGSPDPTNNNELAWSSSFDLGASVRPGLNRLLIAAIGRDGEAGTQLSSGLCVLPSVPDNGYACNPARPPPAFVVSLGWSNAADLDLRVVEPSGAVVSNDASSESRTTAVGRLLGDTNSSCVRNGIIRESVVWQDTPPSGTYLVYVNLHSPCSERAAPFVVSTHAREALEGGELRQVETYRTAGNFVAVQANGGKDLGLFVTEFQVN